jgi:sulfhydrogenase subunit alpha
MAMSRTVAIEHLGRVEGHGGITVEFDAGMVSNVRFDIYEGIRLLEPLLRGRSYEDVSQVLSRICAICSTAHALTSIKATENAFGVQVTPQTERLRDLMYRGVNIESHALHLFLLALPDYLGYSGAPAMAAEKAEVVKLGLRLKKLGNSLQEAIGGRAVHPVNAVPGGFGRVPADERLIALRHDLVNANTDAGSLLEIVASLPAADFGRCETGFAAMRPSKDYGYYRGEEIAVVSNGIEMAASAAGYRRLLSDEVVPHSHAKHRTFGGRPVMVGALARLTVNRQILNAAATRAMRKVGLQLPSAAPTDNNKAQAVELAMDVAAALETVEDLLAGGLKDEARVPVRPAAGAGAAVTEAPRGLLIHSYTYDERGRIVTADVITPTSINAAPIERALRKTAEECGAVEDAALVRRLEMVARAYDPCLSCSVHLVTAPNGT